MASLEGEAPTKQYVTIIEKKVRNLEKRKVKLDSYKIKASEGAVLDKDQKDAVSKYDQVVQNLEFSKELLKQFQQLNVENEKVQRKQAKRDKIERQNSDISRLKDVLKIQHALKTAGDSEARKGSDAVLSEEKLKVLNDFQNLLSLSADAELSQKCGSASEHLYQLLEKSEKVVFGEVTYKDVAELTDIIIEGFHFETDLTKENDEAQENNPVFDLTLEIIEDGQLSNGNNAAASESVCSKANGFEVNEATLEVNQDLLPEMSEASVVENGACYQNSLEALHHQQDIAMSEQELQSEDVLPLQSPSIPQGVMMTGHWPNSESLVQPQLVNRAQFSAPITAQYFGSGYEGQRPVREIVSSMQGHYNFLQESLIDGKEHQVNINNSSIVNLPVDVVASSSPPPSHQQMMEHHHQQDQHLPMATIAGLQTSNFAEAYQNRLQHHHLLHHHHRDVQNLGMPTTSEMYFQQQQQRLYRTRVPLHSFYDLENQTIPEAMEPKHQQLPSISAPSSSVAYPSFHSMPMPDDLKSEGRNLQPFMMGVPSPDNQEQQSQPQLDGPYTMNPNANIFRSGFHATPEVENDALGDVQSEPPQNGSPDGRHAEDAKEVGVKTFAQTASSGKSYQEFTNTQNQRGPKAGVQYLRYPNRQQFTNRQGNQQPPYNNSNTNNPQRSGNAPYRGGAKFGPGGARPSSQGGNFYQRNEHYHS